jgi:hypothetical protein
VTRVVKLKRGWRANKGDSELGLCILAGTSAQAARPENEGTTNFRNVGEPIANNTTSYCNAEVRSSNVAMYGVSRHDRIEVMLVKVRSSMRHKSDGRSYACVYCMPSQRTELFSVSASNGLGRYIVYALDKRKGWKTTDKKGAGLGGGAR